MASVPYPQWSDSEEDKQAAVGDKRSGASSIIELSEDNTTFVSSAFTVLPSTEPKQVRDSFPCPGLEETHCPRLDPLFKSASVSKDIMSTDS